MSLHDITIIHEGELNLDATTALEITVVRGEDDTTGDGDRWGFAMSRVPGITHGLICDTLVVEDVQPKSWAEAAGLVACDVIVEFDGVEVSKFAGRIIDMLRNPKGRVLKLKVLPAQQTLKPDTETGAGPLDICVSRPTQTTPPIKWGMHTAQHFAGGSFVTAVLPDTLAEEAGVRRGDFIVRVNGGPTEDMDDEVKLAATLAESQMITLSIIRRTDWIGRPPVLTVSRAVHYTSNMSNAGRRSSTLGNHKSVCQHLKLQI